MTHFYNPYQFIPLSKPTDEQLFDYQQIADGETTFIRHDRWDENALSGRIVCRLETISPLVIGANQKDGEKEQAKEVVPYREGQALPANSLRGMVASVVEGISNSALRVLSNQKEHEYFVRRHYRHPLKEMGVLIQENGQWCVYPLNGARYRVKKNQLNGQTTYQHENNNALVKANISNSWANLDQNGEATGILYRRGIHDSMPGKKYETFIKWNGKLEGKPLSVKPGLVERFNQELINRIEADKKNDFPHMPEGYLTPERQNSKTLVRSGDLTYFRVDDKAKIVIELSYSAIWRRPAGNLYDAIKSIDENLPPWNPDRKNNLTPAEALFGVIEKAADGGRMEESSRNLASRLRFHDAEAESKVDLPEKHQTLRILASPKPPSPSMYFRADNGGCVSKQNLDLAKHVPNGRKRYLPHPDWNRHHWETGNENDKQQKLCCYPIPEKTVYWFHIDFENLSANELDLLRTALFPAPEFQHQLGLGKPLGLGQVKIEEAGVFLIDRQARYTLKGLGCDRYHRVLRHDKWKLPECHAREKKDQTNMDRAALAVNSNPLIEQSAMQTLKQLGSPRYLNQGVPVCYPFHSAQKHCEEGEGYTWFEQNDGAARKQCLEKIEAGKQLPVLDSDTRHWKPHTPAPVSATAIRFRLSGIKPRNQRNYDDESVKQAIVQQWPGTRVIRVSLGKSWVELEPSDDFPVADAPERTRSFPVGDDGTLTLNPPRA